MACAIMDDLGRIRARLRIIPDDREREVKRAIAAAQTRGAELDAEESELKAAERVLMRLRGQEPELPATPDSAPRRRLRPGGQKPQETPSVPDMIWYVLFRNPKGLKPSEMLPVIAERWRWPNVAPNDVGPIAWRMWKRGDLIKDGTRYRIDPEVIKAALKDEAPGSTEPSAPSHPDDGDGTPSSNESGEAHTSLTELPGASPADPGP